MSQQSVMSNKADLTKLNADFMNTNDFTKTNAGKKQWLQQVRGAGCFMSQYNMENVSCLNTKTCKSAALLPTGQATQTQAAQIDRPNDPRIKSEVNIPEPAQPETKTQNEKFNLTKLKDECEICLNHFEQCTCVRNTEYAQNVKLTRKRGNAIKHALVVRK